MGGRLPVALTRRSGGSSGGRRSRVARNVSLHAWPQRRCPQHPGACASRVPQHRRSEARCTLRLLGGHASRTPRRDEPRDRVAGSRPAAGRARGGDCVERGYLLVPVMLRHEATGDLEAAYATAASAAEIAERFDDVDLLALAVHEQGLILINQGRVEEGLRLVDEAMVAVTAGELSPIVTGIVYCSVISGCQEVYALRRAQEWTTALTRWCEDQPDMVAFSGQCLVHRAEIMELHGAWQDALEEAQRARQRCEHGYNQSTAAQAFYLQGEIHRLRGKLSAAEDAYRDASRYGREPQPGLALLRLTQGNDDAAAAAIQRAMGETTDPLKRARLLPACVEIMLAVGDVEEASGACRELQEISVRYDSAMLAAMVAHARGAVDLAEGDARAALRALRRAWQEWQELE